jgi:aspartate racemase
MKTLGLIGGISWHSTIEYYRLINQQVGARLGGLHSAKLLLYSVDFQEVIPTDDGWPRISALFCDVASRLERAGAEALVLCANTAHRVADEVQDKIGIPLIHIADATGRKIQKQNLSTVALLGTRFTMEQAFFRERLSRMGIEALIPDEADRNLIHETIFGELTHGVMKPETKRAYLEIIDKLVARGARGIILGCTEIPLLIKAGDSPLPIFDTTEIHATAAVDFALT